ncbi:uncharacterized protein LOC133800092 [Humulus lupulus]|uniref:uncharacterized protein LOC133800092 n=1 Tax=Humulus lupulus TaxID=3486 RepID=UPI002B413B80|nr:uncharacterized protein LOC133800092 [Humulus lupulus]
MLNTRPQGNFPSNIVVNPKEQCRVITLRSGKQYEQLEPKEAVEKKKEMRENYDSVELEVIEDLHSKEVSPLITFEHHIRIPYPQRLWKSSLDKHFSKFLEVFKKLHINIPCVEALEKIPSYVKFMKEILSKKMKMEDYETIALTKECSAILQRKLPQKLRDPGSFTIPCTNGNFECKHALCDLGASINLIPLSVFHQLGLGEARPTMVTLQLTDRSVKHPRSIIEDVLVKVDKFIFPADFIVFYMEKDANVPIILGRPFLVMGQALIDAQKGELRLRVQWDEVVFNVFKSMEYPQVSDSCFNIDVVDGTVSGTSLGGDPLNITLTKADVENEDGKEVMEYVNWVNSNRPYYGRKFEELGQGPDIPLPFIEKPLTLELKSLPDHLHYAYLDENETLLVIVSSSFSKVEVEKLLRVLWAHKLAIGWTLANIIGISLSTVMHRILMEDDSKPSI